VDVRRAPAHRFLGFVVAVACVGCVACAAAPRAGPQATVRGRLLYEYREVKPDLSGLGAVALAPAAGVSFAVRADGRVLASGQTDASGGFFARLPAPLPADARVVFTAAALDDHGRPRLAVAHAGPRERASPGLWSWSFPPAQTVCVIRVAEGSGALRLFEPLVYGVGFASRVFAQAHARKLPSLVVLWSPGVPFPCFACFEGREGGGVEVGEHRFDSVIWLDGTDGLAQAWTPSVVAHELGHWVMAVYGWLPDDDHEHTLTERLSPQTAWLEGWATFFGQVTLSARRGRDVSRVVAVDSGIGYALDLATGHYDDPAEPREKPAPVVPRAGMKQEIAEGVVAEVLWRLREVCGERAVLLGIAEPRLTGSLDRGAPGKDLVDFLDALLCSGRATRAQVDAVVKERFHFPYDGRPLCPGSAAPHVR
jgi:hypothetical protein